MCVVIIWSSVELTNLAKFFSSVVKTNLTYQQLKRMCMSLSAGRDILAVFSYGSAHLQIELVLQKNLHRWWKVPCALVYKLAVLSTFKETFSALERSELEMRFFYSLNELYKYMWHSSPCYELQWYFLFFGNPFCKIWVSWYCWA